MSIYSDYKVGALTYDEFIRECVLENLREKYYDEYYENIDYDYCDEEDKEDD